MSRDAQQSYSLQYDEEDKPYLTWDDMPELRLRGYDPSFNADLVTLLNDPSIGQWSFRRPFPYTIDHAVGYSKMQEEIWGAGTEVMKRCRDPAPPRPAGNYPLCFLQYLASSTEGVSLSQLGIRPGQIIGDLYFFPFAPDGQATKEMLDRDPRDQTWEVAYDLFPGVQGRGIGYRLLSTGLRAWAETLGIGRVVATVEETNGPSRALVRKCGFVELERFITPWPEDKGGGERKTIRYVWRHPQSR